jgi:hypothetical protein
MIQMIKFFNLGRPIDFSYRTNRWIVILSGTGTAAAFIFRLLSRVPLGESLLFAVGAGGTCFLGWAITRELDPDRPFTAFPAAIVSLAAAFFLGFPGFLQLFLFLYILRGMTGITGEEIQIGDVIVMIGLAVWLVLLGHWIYGAITGAALLVTALLSKKPWLTAASGTAFLLIIIPFLIGKAVAFRPEITLPSLLTVMIITLLYGLFLILLTDLSSLTDNGKNRVQISRVKTAGFFLLITSIGVTLVSGDRGVITLLPVWTAFFFIPVVPWVFSVFPVKSENNKA